MLHHIGEVYMAQAKYDVAEQTLQRALTTSKQIKDVLGQATTFVRNGSAADVLPDAVSVWELTGYESESPTAPLTSGAGLPGLEKAPPVNACICCTAPERKGFQLRPDSGHPGPS